MGRFCPTARSHCTSSRKAKRIWKKSETAVLHKKLTYNFKVMRKKQENGENCHTELNFMHSHDRHDEQGGECHTRGREEIQGNSQVPPGFPTCVVPQTGWSRRRGACQQREGHSKFLSYLTGARCVHPW